MVNIIFVTDTLSSVSPWDPECVADTALHPVSLRLSRDSGQSIESRVRRKYTQGGCEYGDGE